jgi:hypothetical protein
MLAGYFVWHVISLIVSNSMKKLIGAFSVISLIGLLIVDASFGDQAPPAPTTPAPTTPASTNAPAASVNFFAA